MALKNSIILLISVSAFAICIVNAKQLQREKRGDSGTSDSSSSSRIGRCIARECLSPDYCKKKRQCPSETEITFPDNGVNLVFTSNCEGCFATPECAPGYEPNVKEVQCQKVGRKSYDWQDWECRRKDCGQPCDVENGSIQPGSTKFEDTRTVECNTGYLPASYEIECLATGKWSTGGPCTIIECPLAGITVANGVIRTVTTTIPFGDVISVDCKDGFIFNGGECLDTGVLEAATCEVDSTYCILTNLQVLAGYACGEDRVAPGGTVDIVCNPGSIPNPSIATCSNGVWNPSTVTCEVQDCDAFPVDFGSIVGKTSFGSQRDINCITGYEPTSESTRCVVNNDNDPFFSPTPKCVKKDCGRPKPCDGVLILSYVPGASNTKVGAVYQVECEDNCYKPSAPEIVCGSDGTWNTVTCNIITCSNFEDFVIEFGRLEYYEAVTCGGYATVNCNDGYILQSGQCTSTGSFDTLTCDRDGTACDVHDISVTNGIVKGAGLILSETSVEIVCYPGFTSGTRFVKCDQFGDWETLIVNCDPEAK